MEDVYLQFFEDVLDIPSKKSGMIEKNCIPLHKIGYGSAKHPSKLDALLSPCAIFA